MNGGPGGGPGAEPGGASRGTVVVFRSSREREVREHALVLQAVGIDCLLEVIPAEHDATRATPLEGEWQLSVAAPDAARARLQLQRFELENRTPPPPEADSLGLRSTGLDAALAWGLVLVAVFVFARGQAWGLDWEAAGLADARAIRAGAWWRAVTALTLHSDLTHLAGNVFFGGLFLALLCRLVGTGAGLAATLLAGTLGNAANALLQEGTHRSLGASTAVFGALGVLAAVVWRHRARVRQRLTRRWSPVLMAVFLLGYLGTEGARTDVLAHVTGLGCGLLLGAFPLGWTGPGRPRLRTNLLWSGAVLGLMAAAWWCALQSA